MTAQIPDYVDYDGEEYALLGLTGGPLFSIRKWGIEPKNDGFSGNWRGYTIRYHIDDGIYVTSLYANSSDGLYPTINGVDPVDQVYENLNLRINYTGKVQLGTGFLRDYYVHQGFQQAGAFEKVLDFLFEDGRLIQIIDRSEDAKHAREKADSPDREVCQQSLFDVPDLSIDLK